MHEESMGTVTGETKAERVSAGPETRKGDGEGTADPEAGVGVSGPEAGEGAAVSEPGDEAAGEETVAEPDS